MKVSRTVLTLAAVAGIAVGLVPTAPAKQIDMDVALSNPYLLAGEKNTVYLKVGLTGFEFTTKGDRTPVNIALVIDKSGSMSGEKMRRAREAALMAVDRLNANDIVSVVAYSDTVEVIVPATKASAREQIRKGIRNIKANGSTALFAGVSKGASEVRKFLDRNRVNRVVLVSDGLANVGPSSPGQLGDLGASLARDGISVTTIGLGNGYNEDLMEQLASRSDGNHAFAENATDLAGIFNSEFGDILSVVAQDVRIRINCARGVRPVRVLGREAEISGREVVVSMNQLYSEQEKYVMLEIEVPGGPHGKKRDVADVEVAYANMESGRKDKITSDVGAEFTRASHVIESNTDKKVMTEAILQTTSEWNEQARKLSDEGDIVGAQQIFYTNYITLDNAYKEYGDERLNEYSRVNHVAKEKVKKPAEWKSEKKRQVDHSSSLQSQRAW